MQHTLARIFSVEQGEGRATALATTLSFCLGFSGIFVFSASRAIFLKHFEASDLSYVYMGIAVAVMTVGYLFARVGHSLRPERLAVATLLFMFFSILGFRIWFLMGGDLWPALLLAVWFNVCFLLTSLSFWTLCSRLFDVRQAKRLYALIGSGEFLAAVLAGCASPFLVRAMGTENLLYLACGGLLGGVGIALALGRLLEQGRTQEDRARKPRVAFKPGQGLHDRYQFTLHVLWALSICGLYLTDAALNVQAKAHFPDTDALAGFFGLFYAGSGVVILLFRSLLSGRIINKLGPATALFQLPGLVMLATLALALSTSLFHATDATLFLLALACRVLDFVLRSSIHKPAYQVLYQPLPPQKRLATQTSVEGLAEPLAILAVGALLLFGRAYVPFRADYIAIALLAILVPWLAAIHFVRGQYTSALMEAVDKRVVSSGEFSLADSHHKNLVARRLESPYPAEVIFCMDLLEKNAPELMESVLLLALFHPAQAVQLDALARIERLKVDYAKEQVALFLETTEEPQALAAALRAYAAIAGHEAAPVLTPYLDHDDPRVVAGAVVGMFHGCDDAACGVAHTYLADMAAAGDPMSRALAASALGMIGPKAPLPLLEALVRDPVAAVSKTAMAATEKIRDPQLAPVLIDALAAPRLGAAAARALGHMGDAALPAMAAACAASTDRRTLSGLVRAAAHNPGDAATAFLHRLGMAGDPSLRLQALNALQARGYHAQPSEAAQVRALIEREAAAAAWFLAARLAIADAPACQALAYALRDEERDATGRVFALLSFLCPPRSVAEAQKNLRHPAREKKAYALEILENVAPAPLKRLVAALATEDVAHRRAFMSEMFPTPPMDAAQVIATVAAQHEVAPSAWTRTAALYAAGLRGDSALAPVADAAKADADAALAETALWTLARLVPPVPTPRT
ncbi:MAG: MFS transporter [Desulfovibrionaceae bacterium]